MDILEEKGFSIIEALVGIVLLGTLVVFTVFMFNNIWANPAAAFKGEAFYLANQEIENSINRDTDTDTSYFNYKNTLIVERKVIPDNDMKLVTVTVNHVQSKKEIVALSVMLRR